MAETLWASVQRLAPLNPRFVSVTYGADGSTRQRTHHLVHRIQSETTLTGAPHLTCIGTTREELIEIARCLLGRRYPPYRCACAVIRRRAAGPIEPQPDGFAYAADLVAALRRVADFEISVAAYPEGHPQAPSTDVRPR